MGVQIVVRPWNTCLCREFRQPVFRRVAARRWFFERLELAARLQLQRGAASPEIRTAGSLLVVVCGTSRWWSDTCSQNCPASYSADCKKDACGRRIATTKKACEV